MNFLYLTLAQAATEVAANPATEAHFHEIIDKLVSLGPSFGIMIVLIYFLYKHLKEKDLILLNQTKSILDVMNENRNAIAGFVKNQENLNQILTEILDKIDELDTKVIRMEDEKRRRVIERDRGDTQKRP